MKMSDELICVFCKNFYMDFEGDYDTTAGNGFSAGCYKNHWYMGDVDVDVYRNHIIKAGKCNDYNFFKEVKKENKK